jgi:hypothetical protein
MHFNSHLRVRSLSCFKNTAVQNRILPSCLWRGIFLGCAANYVSTVTIFIFTCQNFPAKHFGIKASFAQASTTFEIIIIVLIC